jgi:hypothetical protein
MLLFAFIALSFSQAVTIDLGAALESYLSTSSPTSAGFGPSGALGLYSATYAAGGALSAVTVLSAVPGEVKSTTGIPGGSTSFEGWYQNPGNVPAIMVNANPTTAQSIVSSLTTPTPPGDVFLHAGDGNGTNGNAVIYRWTAPQAGTLLSHRCHVHRGRDQVLRWCDCCGPADCGDVELEPIGRNYRRLADVHDSGHDSVCRRGCRLYCHIHRRLHCRWRQPPRSVQLHALCEWNRVIKTFAENGEGAVEPRL